MIIDYIFYKKPTNTSAPCITKVALKTLQMAQAGENAWNMRVTIFAPDSPLRATSWALLQHNLGQSFQVLKERAVMKSFLLVS